MTKPLPESVRVKWGNSPNTRLLERAKEALKTDPAKIPAGGPPTKLNAKEFLSPKFADLKKYGPTRTIAGLSLQDFLGRR